MFNRAIKLNPILFDKDVEQIPTRKGFGEGLLAAGEADERVVGLCADLTESTYMNLFKAKFLVPRGPTSGYEGTRRNKVE